MHQTQRVLGSLLLGLSVLVFTVGGGSSVQAQGAHAKITSAKAKAIALKKYPGNIEGKINLENEDGSWQYAVNVRSGKTLREVMVNATTGKIASVEVTTTAEEAKETRAEAKAKTTKRHTP